MIQYRKLLNIDMHLLQHCPFGASVFLNSAPQTELPVSTEETRGSYSAKSKSIALLNDLSLTSGRRWGWGLIARRLVLNALGEVGGSFSETSATGYTLFRPLYLFQRTITTPPTGPSKVEEPQNL